MQLKIRISKTRYIALNITKTIRVTMDDGEGGAWDNIVHVGRCLEKSKPNIRAYQMHVLWFWLSYWRTDCKPLAHGLHEIEPNPEPSGPSASAESLGEDDQTRGDEA